MSDLISRAEAIDAVKKVVIDNDVVSVLSALPSADAERLHGEWIDVKMDYGECSECGFFGITTDYCPNCGAKMKGGAE